jgi:hypothetical protein
LRVAVGVVTAAALASSASADSGQFAGSWPSWVRWNSAASLGYAFA